MTLSRAATVALLLLVACGSPPSEPAPPAVVDETGENTLPDEEEEPLPPPDEEEEPLPPPDEEEEPLPPPDEEEEPLPPPDEEEEPLPPPDEEEEPLPPPDEEEEPLPPPDEEEEPLPPPDEEEATTDDPIDLMNPSRVLASRAIFEATNAARTGEGLPPLQLCELCEVAAQQHADDMERLNFSSHDNPDPERRTPGMRLAAAGVNYSAWAENIGYHSVRRGSGTYSYRALAESMVEWWMSSPGHRANILWTDVTHLGGACTLELDGSYPRMLCVENFVRLRR